VVNTLVAKRELSDGERRLFSGEVKPARSSDLGFARGGSLAGIYVSEGEAVVAEQLLAELDNQRLVNKRDRLVEARDGLQAELEAIPAELPPLPTPELINGLGNIRAQALALERTATQPSQSAQTRRGLAELQQQIVSLNTPSLGLNRDELARQISELEAQISDANLEIDEGRIYAPYDGLIELFGAGEGSVISAGRPIGRLIENTRLEVQVAIPAHLAKTISLESTVKALVAEETLTATVKSISPQVDGATRSRNATFELADTAGSTVVPGDLAQVEFAVGNQESGFWLPRTALAREVQGLWSVLVAEPVGDKWVAARRYVDLIRLEAERVFLDGLLEEGELVIADGLFRIVPGQTVNPGQAIAPEIQADATKPPVLDAERRDGVPSG
jgi:RND family efflux transporter MFP subunit